MAGSVFAYSSAKISQSNFSERWLVEISEFSISISRFSREGITITSLSYGGSRGGFGQIPSWRTIETIDYPKTNTASIKNTKRSFS